MNKPRSNTNTAKSANTQGSFMRTVWYSGVFPFLVTNVGQETMEI